MNTQPLIYHGNFLYAPNPKELVSHQNSYLVAEDGIIQGIYPVLPEKYKDCPVNDLGNKTVIPAFSDLHVHAPQYAQRGIAMDLLLEDWLHNYTFPLEARYADLSFAKPIYDAFAEDMFKQGTAHACIYGTIHVDSTLYLMETLERHGLGGYVGKINMDMDSPDYLCETVEGSLKATEEFLDRTGNLKKIRPILTPRFAPTCSGPLLEGLGKLAAKYRLGCQTHIVESKWEAAQAVKLYPEWGSDMGIYEHYGFLGYGPFLAGHFIYPTQADLRIMKEYQGIAVHCPDSTANVIAGIISLAALEDLGIAVGIGSDVAAGQSLAVYKQVAAAVRMSKLKELYEPEENSSITFTSAFYHATKEAGSIFGKTGSLEAGYRLEALAIDDLSDPGLPLSPAENIERFCYCGDERNITRLDL